jgi:hypothetical protein
VLAASLLLAALSLGMRSAARGADLDDVTLRAAFLFNFAKYVDWPPDAFARTDGSLVLCVVQDRRLVEELARQTEGANLDGHPVWVHAVGAPDEATSCQVLYVADADEPRLPAIRRAIEGLPVLTVGDGRTFLNRGGMIALVSIGGRLRFEIDNEHAEAAGLKLSSQLLKLARRVVGVRGAGGAS